MTRFFLTPSHAAQVMWDALFGLSPVIYKPGDILIPNCKSFKLIDLAEIMVENSGKSLDIYTTEPLPYEKIHESLVTHNSFKHLVQETSKYYVLDLDELQEVTQREVLSNDPERLLSKEQFRELLLQENII